MTLWLFGEAEYDTTKSFEENYQSLFDVSEACGYMIAQPKHKLEGVQNILIEGTDLDVVKILFSAGSKCNMLVISKGQTNQEGSALAQPLRQGLRNDGRAADLKWPLSQASKHETCS